jgi:hypothetical protein
MLKVSSCQLFLYAICLKKIFIKNSCADKKKANEASNFDEASNFYSIATDSDTFLVPSTSR